MPIKAMLTANGMSPQLAAVICGTVNTSVTAAGTTHADAAQLTIANQFIISSGAANSGVILPASGLGPSDAIAITNYTGNNILLYPPSGGQLNNGTATTGALIVPQNGTVEATCNDALNFSVTNIGKPAYWS